MGGLALFTKPEFKSERCSYPVLTPSVARGILDSIYWNPHIKWIIDKIYVIKPIRYTTVTRNGVNNPISSFVVMQVMNGKNKPLFENTKKDRMLTTSRILKDVSYVVDAHFEVDPQDTQTKPKMIKDMVKRRIKRGQCFQTPYFGCREFPVKFAFFDEDFDIRMEEGFTMH